MHANSVAINVPDPDDPDMDLVYRTESNVIHFRLSSPQRFVVACFATTAAFGLIILLVESKMNWNWATIKMGLLLPQTVWLHNMPIKQLAK